MIGKLSNGDSLPDNIYIDQVTTKYVKIKTFPEAEVPRSEQEGVFSVVVHATLDNVEESENVENAF